MAITQIGSTSNATTTDPTASLVLTKPTGLAVGDVMIAAITSNDVAHTVPTNWVAFDGDTLAPTTLWQVRLYYKIVDGTEGASFSWSVGTGGPSAGILNAWRGVDNASPIAGTNDSISNTTATEPMTTVTVTVTGDRGKLFYVRAARKTSAGGTGGTFSDGDADTFGHGTNSGVSSTGNTAYSVGLFSRTTQYTTSGSKAGLDITYSATESQNYTAQFALREDNTGTTDSTLPSVTSALAGYHRIDAALDSQLPPVAANFAGIAAPPSGTMDTALPPVSASIAAASIGGGLDAQLPPVSSSIVGAVNPIGGFASQLPSLAISLVVETQPFGEHVIRPAREDRAFRVIDADPGLVPIKRSQVTQQ